ncbi:hypothetical protein PanWU01x14_104570 [Parasponia andersonii]|uniref:Uncharacterized protein n=1 Tax=Parasponia andersonii TaxID=3476 RepID=A0A2P5D1W2_PARAD|nr:hypothetical protein PanWU01x14_104570 [Parasponia andersonii]
MAGSGTTDEEMDSLLSTFDHIQEDFKSGLREIRQLKWTSDGEIKKREAVELACQGLEQENERLNKLYTESLNNLVDQELREAARESVEQEFAKKIADLEARIRGLLLEKATNEAVVSQLRQDLEAHKSHIQYLAVLLCETITMVFVNDSMADELEIKGLRDCITSEQEEKNELNKKLQHLEKELLLFRSKHAKQQPYTTLNSHVATLLKKGLKEDGCHILIDILVFGLKEDGCHILIDILVFGFTL